MVFRASYYQDLKKPFLDYTMNQDHTTPKNLVAAVQDGVSESVIIEFFMKLMIHIRLYKFIGLPTVEKFTDKVTGIQSFKYVTGCPLSRA